MVQWESCWIDADIAPAGRVIEVLLRRVVRVQNQMLVQWACTMIPIYVVRRRHADGDIVVDEAMVVAVVGR